MVIGKSDCPPFVCLVSPPSSSVLGMNPLCLVSLVKPQRLHPWHRQEQADFRNVSLFYDYIKK